MLDQLESMENAAEGQYYDMLQPDGRLKQEVENEKENIIKSK